MRKDKHEELVTFEHEGKRFSAYITGVPDKCQHDDEGEQYVFNDEGKYWKQSEIPDYKKDNEAYMKFMNENEMRGGCVSCSKCGKPYEPDLHEMP
mgnify:CR=1 FL=1